MTNMNLVKVFADAASNDHEEFVIEKKGIHLRGAPMYLDMQATTPMDPRVVDAMLPFMTEQYGNPHSRTHLYGWEAEDAVEEARAQVASIIGADPKEIVFTSGPLSPTIWLLKE